MTLLWLWLSFTLVGIVVCLTLSRIKLSIVAQIIVVALVIWYGIAMYFLPGQLTGWPRQIPLTALPANNIILSYTVVEPSPNDKGAIYVWLVDYRESKRLLKQILDPSTTYERDKTVGVPRSYEIPYTRDMHKKMEEAKAKAGKSKGMMAIEKGKKTKREGEQGQDIKDEVKVVVISPAQLLIKNAE